MHPLLQTKAVIVYVAIALIGTGIYEKSEGRIALGVGLLAPTQIPALDKRLEETKKSKEPQ